MGHRKASRPEHTSGGGWGLTKISGLEYLQILVSAGIPEIEVVSQQQQWIRKCDAGLSTLLIIKGVVF